LAGQGTGPAADLLDAWLDGPAGADGGPGPVPRAHPRTLIEATLLSALLAAEGGDEALARRRLEEAVELLDASGVRAPFVLHAERVVPLLERHAGEMGTHRSLAVGLLDRLAHDMGSLLPIEALTDRELEVLHHLPTLMSNVEIAAGMHVSVNTVKTHLKAVYRKLGVDGRRQAVLRGRELELI
ncbi:MAG TPA: LuxR C-terminal-related transcriptional regulator, partial [Acidimicrobiales bacterium]